MSHRREAGAVLRRIIQALPMPPGMSSYLSGYADGLDATPKRRRRSR